MLDGDYPTRFFFELDGLLDDFDGELPPPMCSLEAILDASFDVTFLSDTLSSSSSSSSRWKRKGISELFLLANWLRMLFMELEIFEVGILCEFPTTPPFFEVGLRRARVDVCFYFGDCREPGFDDDGFRWLLPNFDESLIRTFLPFVSFLELGLSVELEELLLSRDIMLKFSSGLSSL